MQSNAIVNFPVQPAGSAIWRSYFVRRQGNKLPRTGYLVCGANPEEEAKTEDPMALTVATMDEAGNVTFSPEGSRAESITEHSAGCNALMKFICMFYPELFIDVQEWEKAALDYYYPRVVEVRSQLSDLFDSHDDPEIFMKDILDDGRKVHASRDEVELNFFRYTIKELPAEVQRHLTKSFVGFQHPLGANFDVRPTLDSKRIQLAKCIDKLDALLRAIIYEVDGHPGTLDHKKRYVEELTKQDSDGVRICGTDAIVDVWSSGFFKNYHMYHGFHECVGILYAAVVETRGEWFNWLDSFKADTGIEISPIIAPPPENAESTRDHP